MVVLIGVIVENEEVIDLLIEMMMVLDIIFVWVKFSWEINGIMFKINKLEYIVIK